MEPVKDGLDGKLDAVREAAPETSWKDIEQAVKTMNEEDQGRAMGKATALLVKHNDVTLKQVIESGEVNADKALIIIQAYAINVAEEKKQIFALGRTLPLNVIGPIIDLHFREADDRVRLRGDAYRSDVFDEISAIQSGKITHARDRRLRNECMGVLAKIVESPFSESRLDVLNALKKAAKQQKEASEKNEDGKALKAIESKLN
ncbi:MAG: hypothetical protein Greene041662_755 [Candidatus Peregrinibacteria bacterium Greene0416_62]|nr:MAG: hypothetical protein Greene041662_755 [Candidatus Peregrinibacteria bacterium Greene0416_62]TSD00674.1 MAG: hypothetical protein Greene101449_48 [Candidatus Peregrinibacteria bacterium Greene1014_49]